MTLRFWQDILAAGIGTFAFAVLFHVPRRYYLRCAVTGAAGWFVFLALQQTTSPTLATFVATLAVVFMSRLSSIQLRCPVTIFLISGIFPMVPGLGIYRTAYYMVSNDPATASSVGFATVKTAIIMVLAILLGFEVPSAFLKAVTRLFSKRRSQ